MTAVQPEPRPRFSFRPLWLRADRASDPLLELQKSLRLFGVLSGIFMSVHAYVTPFTHIDLVSGNEMLWVLTILGFFVAFVLSTYTPTPLQAGATGCCFRPLRRGWRCWPTT